MAELAPLDNPSDYRLGFAGDTFNTAWYLRQLRSDAEISYLSAVGRDDISDKMIGFMESAGIGTGSIARHANRSVGMYLISLRDGERSFSYWRDTSAARLLAEDEAALGAAMAGVDLVYFSGITLAILSDDARVRFMGALKAARAQGVRIAFDPNLRPRLWQSTDQMTATIMQGAQVSDIALPSFEDEADYFGDANPQATAERYAGAGATCVVVKNGAAPVYFMDGADRGEVPVTPATNVVDTTSAGDSFNAGFFATLNADLPMPSQIEMAAAVAGQAIGGKGALVPLDKSRLPFAIPST